MRIDELPDPKSYWCSECQRFIFTEDDHGWNCPAYHGPQEPDEDEDDPE